MDEKKKTVVTADGDEPRRTYTEAEVDDLIEQLHAAEALVDPLVNLLCILVRRAGGQVTISKAEQEQLERSKIISRTNPDGTVVVSVVRVSQAEAVAGDPAAQPSGLILPPRLR